MHRPASPYLASHVPRPTLHRRIALAATRRHRPISGYTRPTRQGWDFLLVGCVLVDCVPLLQIVRGEGKSGGIWWADLRLECWYSVLPSVGGDDGFP